MFLSQFSSSLSSSMFFLVFVVSYIVGSRRLTAIAIVMMRPNGIRIHTMGIHLHTHWHSHAMPRHATPHHATLWQVRGRAAHLINAAKLIISHQHPIGRGINPFAIDNQLIINYILFLLNANADHHHHWSSTCFSGVRRLHSAILLSF